MKIFFSNFDVDRDRLLRALPDRRPNFWPLDWVVYPIEIDQFGQTSNIISSWIKRENIEGRVDLNYDEPSMVAFSNETDAMLFRLAELDGVTFL